MKEKLLRAYRAAPSWRIVCYWLCWGAFMFGLGAFLAIVFSGCAIVGTTITTPDGWKYTEGGIVLWKGELADLSGTATLGDKTIVERASKNTSADATALATLIEKILSLAAKGAAQ